MEQITVKHPNGTTLDLNSYTAPSVVSSATLKSEFQGTDSIEIKVKSASPLDFYIGDSITFLGAKYTINQTPKIQKKGERDLEYTLTFEGLQYELIDRVFLLVDIDTMRDSLTGTLEDFLKILVKNANRDNDYTWSYQIDSVGIGEAEVKTESFDENNCLEVLQQLMEDFECEFRISADDVSKTRVIRIGSDGTLASSSLGGYVFEYGEAGGAYELKREPADNTNIVTRLFVYGSNNNINTSENGVSVPYRSTRLCLPNKAKNESYIEDSELIDLFGVKEGIISLDDIEPTCKGVVRSVTGEAGSTTFTAYIEAPKDDREYDIDFDIHDYLMPDTNASIIFQTGELAGYEFDLSGDDNNGFVIDNGYVTINFNSFYDENGMRFPYDGGASFNVQEGDEFLFNNIYFPLKRIESAEEKLQEEGQKQFDATSIPQIKYSLTVDPIWLQRREDPEGTGIVSDPFTVGNTIHVKDTALDLDDSIRISSISRDLLQEWKFTLTLADKTTPNLITKIVNSMQLQDEIIKINDLTNSAKARKNWKTSQEVLSMIFDTEGYYYSDKIAPLSIETTMLSVGARSQQFTLKDLVFQPNYNGNANLVLYSDGTLEHYTIDDLGTVIWQIEGGTVELPSDYSGAYYVYARCGKSYVVGDVNTGATILFSQEQYTFDGNDYYYFLIGMLTSIDNDTETNGGNPSRDLALTYGSTTINGRFIRTGRIQANGSDTYFDLDSGEICGTIRFIDGGSTAEELINNACDYAESVSKDLNYIKQIMPDGSTTISGGVILSGTVAVTDKVGGRQEFVEYSSASIVGSVEETLYSYTAKHDGSLTIASFSATVVVGGYVSVGYAINGGATTNLIGTGTGEGAVLTSSSKTIELSAGDTYTLTNYCTGGGELSVPAIKHTFSYTVETDNNGVVGAITKSDPMIFAGAQGWNYRDDAKFSVDSSGHVIMSDVYITSDRGDCKITLLDGALTLNNGTKSLNVTADNFSTLSAAGLEGGSSSEQHGSFELNDNNLSSVSATVYSYTGSASGGYIYVPTSSITSTSTSSTANYTLVDTTVEYGRGSVTITDGALYIGEGSLTLTCQLLNCLLEEDDSACYINLMEVALKTTVTLKINDTSVFTTTFSEQSMVDLTSSTAPSYSGTAYSGTFRMGAHTPSFVGAVYTGNLNNVKIVLTIQRNFTFTMGDYRLYCSSGRGSIEVTTSGGNPSALVRDGSWTFARTDSELISRLFSNGLIFQGDSTAQQFGVMPTADLGFIASNGNGAAIKVDKNSDYRYVLWGSTFSGASKTQSEPSDQGLFYNTNCASNEWSVVTPHLIGIYKFFDGASSYVNLFSPYKIYPSTITNSSSTTGAFTVTFQSLFTGTDYETDRFSAIVMGQNSDSLNCTFTWGGAHTTDVALTISRWNLSGSRVSSGNVTLFLYCSQISLLNIP